MVERMFQRLALPRLPARVVLGVGLALAYLGLAELGARALPGVSPFWPSAGLAVFAVLRWGWGASAGVLLGSLLANLLVSRLGLAASALASVGNLAGPMLGRALLRRLGAHSQTWWQSPRGVLGFLGGMGAAQAALSAAVGTFAAVTLAHGHSEALRSFLGWATSDACAALMLAPLLQLGWSRAMGPAPRPGRRTWPQALAMFALVLLIWAWAADAALVGPIERSSLLGLLTFPLVWSVFACDVLVTCGLLAFSYLLFVGSATFGLGGAAVPAVLVGMQFLLLAIAGSTLFAMALQQANRKALRKIAEQSARLESLSMEQALVIAEQKDRLQAEFSRLSNLTTLLTTINRVVSSAQDDIGLLQGFCDLIVSLQGVCLAWIGRPDAQGRFVILARAGDCVAYLDGIDVRTDPNVPAGRGSAGQVWRGQRAIYLEDAQRQLAYQPWVDRLQRFGIHATAGLPLLRAGRIWGVLHIYLSFTERFEPALQKVAEEIAADISSGLDRLDVIRREHEQSLLNAALLSNVTVGVHVMRYPERAFEHVNARLLEMRGARDIEHLRSLGQQALYERPDEQARVEALAERVLETGGGSLQGLCCRRLDGSLLHVDLSGVRLDLGDGVRRILWTQIDVTERQRQARQLQRTQGIYRALAAAADSLLQSATEAGMVARLCQSLVHGSEFAAVWVSRADGAEGLLSMALTGDEEFSARGLDALRAARNGGDHAVARAWRTQRSVRRRRAEAGGDAGREFDLLRHMQWESLLAVPVSRGGHGWCVLCFASRLSDCFDDTTTAACEQVAGLLGHGLDELDRKSALQTLQDAESQRARTDELTGLANRLALNEYLPSTLMRAGRTGTVVAVGMLDLDDFKPVNDRLGHAVGDQLLQRLAQTLRATIREGDFLARIGGDEFVVVFENLRPQRWLGELRVALDRLRTAVDMPFDLGGGYRVEVGMTMGLSAFPQDSEEPDTLLRLADAAMYACKLRKHDRSQWWQVGGREGDMVEDRVQEEELDLFGDASSALLQGLDAAMLRDVAEDFTEAFYRALGERPEWKEILGHLAGQDWDRLRGGQAEHLLYLLRPDTTREGLMARARDLGQRHALVGVSGASLEQGYALYEDLLRAQLEKTLISSRRRYRVLRVATARLRLDVQIQLAAIDQTNARYFDLLNQPIAEHARWIDVLTATLHALSELPGMVHVIVFRPDAHGTLLDELGAGPQFEQLSEALRLEELYPSLTPEQYIEPGPLSMAWFTRKVQVVDAYLNDRRLERWHELARKWGWRSAATIPIGGADNADSVLILLGAYPHQFSSGWARSWLELLHGRIHNEFAATATEHRTVAPELVRTVRALLYRGGLRLWVQPIVDLQGGGVSRVEVLARLQGEDGTVFQPAQFLPSFGEQELHALFRQVLDQALALVRAWREQGLAIDVSVNLPPVTLTHPACGGWIEGALREARVAPMHLTLEVLETGGLGDARSDEALHALSALGVRLALDDLGSGYSSLTRLASLPIDTVKIDQALIRELPRDPVKTVRLLATLVRIGEDFARSTVVEGLEDEGFVEVARMLGARHAQGFALARPMPAADLVAWLPAAPQFALSDGQIRTWPGALAYHWARQQRVEPAVAAEDCPLGRFLQRHAAADTQALGWHAALHAPSSETDRRRARDALLQWLGRKVREAYGGL